MTRTQVVLLGLAMASCGSGETRTDARPSTTAAVATTLPPREDGGLRQAVEAYSAAYLGDRPGEAHGLLSARCRSRVTLTEMVSLARGAKLLYGSARLIDYDEDELVGNSARVTYSYDQPAIDQSGQRWTREGGEWHWDGEC